jgi:hypothetical protein
MVEYVIEVMYGDAVVGLVHVERDGQLTRMKPTPDGYSHVKKFRVKARAEAIATNVANSRLAATYGGFIYGSKSTVPPVQSKINRRSAYRSM